MFPYTFINSNECMFVSLTVADELHYTITKALENVTTGHHLQPEAVARAIQLSEERYCGAGAMLGKVAHLTHHFTIVEAASHVS